MLKKTLGSVTLLLTINAFAGSPATFSDLTVKEATKALFKKMVNNQKLPKWAMTGGTDSGKLTIHLNGNEYQIFSSCKPHQCGLEQIAVLYSPKAQIMTGVFAKNTGRDTQQKLVWLNVPSELTIDGKTVLFATLTGSLANHPDWFGQPASATPSKASPQAAD